MEKSRLVFRFASIVAVLVTLTLLFTACSSGPGKSSYSVSGHSSSSSQVAYWKISLPNTVSSEGKDYVNISFGVPSDWSTNDTSLWPNAQLGVSNSAKSEYVAVTSYLTSDYSSGTTINQFYEDVKSSFSKTVSNLVWGQESSVTVNGMIGDCYSFTGTDKTSNQYWLYVLGYFDHYYLVIGWTPKKYATANQAEIEAVMMSFKANVV